MDDGVAHTQHNEQQLAIYRTTLRHLRDQVAKFGGEAPVPRIHPVISAKRSYR